MASPWKFLSNLMTLGRQARQVVDQRKDVEPAPQGFALSTKSLDESLNSAHMSAGEQRALDRSPAVEGSSLILPGTSVHPADGAQKINEEVEATPPKRKARARNLEGIPAASQKSPAVADELIRLEGEIRSLRGQLANKLRLQNAHLETMLERFKR